jgi:TPR repeat protein
MRSVEIGESLAAHYFKLSADQGNADAQYSYGIAFAIGQGIGIDKSLAAHYYKLSAAQGNADAQLAYGFGMNIPRFLLLVSVMETFVDLKWWERFQLRDLFNSLSSDLSQLQH